MQKGYRKNKNYADKENRSSIRHPKTRASSGNREISGVLLPFSHLEIA